MKASSVIRSPRQLAISLRDARIAKGLTQTALAQQTGLGRPWINQLEQGKIENASLSRILALCNALEVTFTVSYEVPSTQDIAPYPSAHASLASNQNTFAETSDALSQTNTPSMAKLAKQIAEQATSLPTFQEQLKQYQLQLKSISSLPVRQYLDTLHDLSSASDAYDLTGADEPNDREEYDDKNQDA